MSKKVFSDEKLAWGIEDFPKVQYILSRNEFKLQLISSQNFSLKGSNASFI